MKALVATEYGPVDTLAIAELPKPVPGPGQVLVKVEAAALNPLDIVLVLGILREFMPVEHPFVPGLDAAGVVESVGEGVTDFAPGDKVVAFTFGVGGTVAEYVLAAQGPGLIARPEGLDAVRAAGLPVAAMTAAALLDASGVEAGKTALVIGATGGVGSFAVQLVAAAGATVVATSSPAAADDVRRLGAEQIIDHTSEDTVARALELVPGGFDAVFDLVNRGPALAASAAAVKPGGKLVSPNDNPGELDRDVTAFHVGVEQGADQLGALVAKAGAGKLSVEVGSVYPFADAGQAVVDFVGKSKRGKVVIEF